MNCQDEYLIYLITKKWTVCQWFNLFCPECQLLRITVEGAFSGGRLKLFPYPKLPRNESTKKFDYLPTHPPEMHPVLAKVFYHLNNLWYKNQSTYNC
jgi:hypothetical protein